MEKTFLFSVDLEDVRERFEGGMRYAPRVPLMVARYLAFLDKHGFKATFFTVGQTAEANPDVIFIIPQGILTQGLSIKQIREMEKSRKAYSQKTLC